MREVVLDTETTGFDPAQGHRLVEVACVELVNYMPTGKELHFYCNPDRDMPPEAHAVHGLTEAFLSDKLRFHEQCELLIGFLGESRLVAHNAEFDLRFLQAELKLCNRPALTAEIVDTLQIARRKFPGSPASLDALCRRFGIDLAERTTHGALIDTRLLGKVYLELMGGKEPGLALATVSEIDTNTIVQRSFRPARAYAPTEEELLAHAELLKSLKDPIWLQQPL